MRKVARLGDGERRALFNGTADKVRLDAGIVEKDFWVCYTLDYLFHLSPWEGRLEFKGGTSLSRVYRLVGRFSEDVDLILDWSLLGYGIDEPYESRSKTKQDIFNVEANRRAERFIAEEFAPRMRADLSEELGRRAEIHVDDDDPQVVDFEYPRLFRAVSTLPLIRIEAGPLSAWSPSEDGVYRPFVGEAYPDLFECPETHVLTVSPERTFWEKAVILHQEANRPEGSEMPPRYSRHYYDVAMLASSPVKDRALRRPGLLREVVDFNMRFYPRGWARYPEAVPGTMRLVPPVSRLPALESDYAGMRDMFYGDAPSFEEMMAVVKGLEDEINGL